MPGTALGFGVSRGQGPGEASAVLSQHKALWSPADSSLRDRGLCRTQNRTVDIAEPKELILPLLLIADEETERQSLICLHFREVSFRSLA